MKYIYTYEDVQEYNESTRSNYPNLSNCKSEKKIYITEENE